MVLKSVSYVRIDWPRIQFDDSSLTMIISSLQPLTSSPSLSFPFNCKTQHTRTHLSLYSINKNNISRWVRTEQERLASPVNTEHVTVPPSVSSFVRWRYHNIPPTVVHSAGRILSSVLLWAFGAVRVVGRSLPVAHTV